MSSTLTVTGNMSMPNSPGGSDTPILIGTPTITPSSTTGPQVIYNEKAKFEFKILAAGVQVVDFGSVASGVFLYIGTDKAVTYKINGGSEVHSLADEGFIMMKGASITALEITGGVLDADEVVVIILGD